MRLMDCIVLLGALLLATDPVRAADRVLQREPIEWSDSWITHGSDTGLPRVLLIGDSLARSYYREVAATLDAKAYVGRFTTSKCIGDPALLEEIAVMLRQYRFDLIHFNNGLHGMGYTEDEYARGFPELLAVFRKCAPGATVIWASTMPVRDSLDLRQFAASTERIRARNAIALVHARKAGLPINDLHALGVAHPEHYTSDGVHFTPKGISAQAEQVAAAIAAHLKAQP